MFFVVVVLAIIGLASLFGVTASSVLTGLGALVIIPILLFKFFLFFMLFGFVARMWGRRSWTPRDRAPWARRWEPAPPRDEPSAEERFEEWHRLAHAKEEVDTWVPEV